MPKGWDGTTKDLDEVLYEISKKEDHMLYGEFIQCLEFNKNKGERISSVELLNNIAKLYSTGQTHKEQNT
ncbi:hypothetical protein GUJ93_ZPchr0006g43359 [Zizania palustris]|uniref:Uncharacterized protein n=1 Tax=Zizania palustris TaxID=103762 RepID=A0A8J5T2P7_ZIZPA|nr:hypothetical protein GUJ93_ZPchr0006g43359 [Zizania palustris]